MRLIGRDAELERLGRVVAAARRGDGGLAVVHGPAGIGKTALLSALTERVAADGDTVIVGRCREAAGSAPYWPWMDALADRARALTPDELAEELGAAAPHLVRSMPELGALVPGVVPSEISTRFALFHAISTWLEAVARRAPLLLVLDDFHAADAASIHALELAVDRLRGARIAFVVAHRDEGPVPPELFRATRARRERVRLVPLDRSSVAALATEVLGRSAEQCFVDELFRRSEGHPLAVLEYVDAGDLRQMPPSLAAAVRERIGDLGPEAVDVLRAAAVLGRDFRPRDVASMLDRPVEQVTGHVTTLLRSGVVVGGDGPDLSFRHGLFVEVVRQDMTIDEREVLHLSAARSLEAAGAPASVIAYHHTQAVHLGSPELAVAALRAAAQASTRRFAFEEAVRLHRTALALLERRPAHERAAVLVELSRALWLSGSVPEADATAWAAVDAAGTPAVRAEAALCVGGGIVVGTEHDARLEQTLASTVPTLGDAELALTARVIARINQLRALRSVTPDVVSDARRAVHLAERFGDDGDRAHTLFMAHFALDDPVHVQERSGLSVRFLAVADRLRDVEVSVHALQFHAVDLLQSERFAELPAVLDRHDALAGTLQQPLYLAAGHLTRAALAVAQCDPALADDHALVALDILERLPATPFRLIALMARVEAARQRRQDTAHLRRQVEDHLAHDDHQVTAALAAALAVESGDLTRAEALYEPFARTGYRITGVLKPVVASLLAETTVALDDRTGARALSEVLEPYRHRLVTGGRPPVAPRGHGAHHLHLLAAVGAGGAERGGGRASIADEGGHLALTYGGRTVRVPASQGLRHVCRLLERPDREVHVAELAGARADLPGLGPVLDGTAKAAFRQRLLDLDRELDEATEHHDLARSARLTHERDMLVDHLAAAVGRMGRDRNPSSSDERARSSVTQAIRRSIRRLQAVHPELADHLDRTVRTGTYCAYRPDPRSSVTWEITSGATAGT